VVRCPICDLLSPNVVAHCVCGYELSTGDTGKAIARLEGRRRDARALTLRGVLTAATGPLVLFSFAWLPPLLAVLTPLLAIMLLSTGVLWTVRGLGDGRDVRRRLRAARRLGELPQARLLTR
jgi:hypothetical protein